MKLARVVGNLVSTINCPSHRGLKLLIVEQIDLSGKACTSRQVAVDTACAGEGDIVIVCDDGGGSRMILGDDTAVIDWTIIGVLDKQEKDGEIYGNG